MYRDIVELIFPIPCLIVHAQDMKQRRRPCRGRTHDRNKLTRFDIEIDAPQDIALRQSLRERFFNVAKTDHWTSCGTSSCPGVVGRDARATYHPIGLRRSRFLSAPALPLRSGGGSR